MVRRGAKRPENQVRRFPVEGVRRSRIGGPPEVANSTPCLARIKQREGKSRNAGSFHWKELPDRAEDRPEYTTRSVMCHLGPFGASDFLRKSAILRRLRPGIKVFALCVYSELDS